MAEFKVISEPIPNYGREPERDIIDALKERYSRPGSPVIKLLSTLQIPQQAMIGMIEEAVRRSEGEGQLGYRERSMGQAALSGVAEPHTSFADVPGVGNKTGVALDLVADPLFLLPQKYISAPLRLAGKPLQAGAKALIENNRFVDKAVTRVAVKFSQNYERARAGFKGYERAVEVPARQAELRARYELAEGIEENIRKLVPDAKRREEILMLAEEVHPRVPHDSPVINQFIGDSLKNADEVAAFRLARENMRANQAYRTEGNLVVKDVATGFEKRTGLSYAQRVQAPKETILENIDNMLAESKWTDDQRKLIQEARRAAEELDSTSDSFINQLEKLYHASDTTVPRESFTKFRGTDKSIRELGLSDSVEDRLVHAALEKDVARVMRVQSIATARAMYRRAYLDSFKKLGEDGGWLVREGKTQTGLEMLRGRGARDMVPIEGVPELKGYLAPRVLAVDLKDVLLSPLDPEKVKNATSMLRKANVWMKGWLLAAPMTVARNALDSVIWRNAAGGMTAKDIGHIINMMGIRMRVARGIATEADEAIWKEMYINGIVRSNIFRETEDVLAQTIDQRVRKGFSRLASPETNPYSKFLFNTGGAVEDIARGSMFMWRKAMGDTAEQAAKHANKWHIDYLYGLTPFERKVRDYWIPFYTFTSRNMPLTLETALYRTKLLAAAGHAKTAVEDIWGGPEPDIPLPEWMTSDTPLRMKWDPKTKTYSVTMLDGLWSFTDFNKFVPSRAMNELVGMVSSLYTTPYQVITNHKTWPEPGAGQKVSRPGDRFELLGMKAEFPLDKRAEFVLRQFRPLNEADKWLQAMSEKYDDSAVQRGVNVFNRMLIGKVYPVTREGQLLHYKMATNEQLKAAYRVRRIAEENGDTKESEEAERQIKEIRRARKMLGIK